MLLACGLTACEKTPYELFATDTSFGGGPSPPMSLEECLEKSGSVLPLEKLRATGPGLCLGRGASRDLLGDKGYDCVLSPCAETWEQLWTIRVDDAGALEIRNEEVDMNMDVQFADSAAGTPLVLYEPHQLYNQRYFAIQGPDDTFQLTPRNAQGQCVEALGASLQLQPCNALTPGQFFRRETCVSPNE
jgi:hypothetical protein